MCFSSQEPASLVVANVTFYPNLTQTQRLFLKFFFRLLDFPLICNKFSTMNSHHYEIRLLKKLKKKVHVDGDRNQDLGLLLEYSHCSAMNKSDFPSEINSYKKPEYV